MKLLTRAPKQTLQDRLIWQSASLLLAYPDDRCAERLDTVERLLNQVTGGAGELLALTAATLRASDPLRAAADYVETFDLRRRTTMYLTYWTAGDTRNRGSEMLAFAAAYRAAGVDPPRDEAPDYLPVALEFAATDPDSQWLAALTWVKSVFAKQQRLSQRPLAECPADRKSTRLNSSHT